MIKKIAVVATSLLVLSNVAFAKFSDEYKKAYPKNVKVTQKQTAAGKMITRTWYYLFEGKTNGGKLALQVIDDGGTDKSCALFWTWTGNKWKFYDKLTWGDGEKVHDLLPAIRPTRQVGRGYVLEQIATEANPEELKNAVIVSAHTQNHLSDILLNAQSKDWAAWKKAIEDAEKIMTEK